MEMISIQKLNEHPRNKEFFDDIIGDRWEDFKDSIVRRGVVEPIVVTQDLTIVSGHQRVRACKELGLLNLPCSIKHYSDAENRTKDDLIIEDLISTNIMQRGVGNVNPIKMAKCIMELERIKGIYKGNHQNVKRDNLTSQSDLAEELNISRRQLQDYKKLTNLIPELQQMIEDGTMKATVGYKIWAKMSQEEQENFFNEIGMDKLKIMTQKATQQYIDENNRLKAELQKEKNKPEKIKEVIVEVEVDNTDYVAMSKIDKIKKENERLREEKESLEKRLQAKKELAEAYENDSNELKKMRNEITYLTQQKDEIGRRIQSITDISGLVVEIDSLIKNKLAPVKYSKSILEAKDDEIVIENLTEIVQVVQSWVDEMKQYIPNKINFVEVL